MMNFCSSKKHEINMQIKIITISIYVNENEENLTTWLGIIVEMLKYRTEMNGTVIFT